MTSQLQRAKRPINPVLAGRYGHPYHPILVTVPIGAWIASLVFDIASHVADDGAFLARGSSWLIGIGVVGALVAAVFGLLDLMAIPRGTRAFRTALAHAGLNVTVVVLYVVNLLWRQAGDAGETAVAAGPLVLSVVSLLALSASGYLGGTLAYRYGVRVADETTQAEGFVK